MSRIYHWLKNIFLNGFHWWLDYVYVGFWQLKGVILPVNFAKYKRGDDSKPAIVLLPGIYERWDFMQPLANLLDENNYRLHIIESLGYNLSTIEEAAEMVSDYINQNKLGKYIIVAHSKGGLIGKYIMLSDSESRCLGMVAINTPFSGSKWALFMPYKSLRIFSPRAPLVKTLGRERRVNSKIVSIYSQFDPHIIEGSKLEGAHNFRLPVRGHNKIIASRLVKKQVLESVKQFGS